MQTVDLVYCYSGMWTKQIETRTCTYNTLNTGGMIS